MHDCFLSQGPQSVEQLVKYREADLIRTLEKREFLAIVCAKYRSQYLVDL